MIFDLENPCAELEVVELLVLEHFFIGHGYSNGDRYQCYSLFEVRLFLVSMNIISE